MRTNFTSDTYSKGQRERTNRELGKESIFAASIHAVKAHYRADLREIRTGKGVEGALGPLNAPSSFFFFFFPFLLSPSSPFLCLLPASNPRTGLWFRPITCPLIQLNTPSSRCNYLFIIEKYIMRNRATADVCARNEMFWRIATLCWEKSGDDSAAESFKRN